MSGVLIRKSFDNSFDNLFCSNRHGGRMSEFRPYPSVMSLLSFNAWLNRLARKVNICSQDGQLWHFRSHQFRRTVATVMTNAGIRDLIIQKYLRHRSPDMQRYYKHLLKQVLKDEYEDLIKEKKYVDITGKIVASHKPKNPVTELLRRKMHQITTPYGECHRPVLKDACQTVNACWRCEHWRTSSNDLKHLEEDLQRLEQELDIAVKLDMVRQQQGLKDDRNLLLTRILGLEQINGN